MTPRLKIKLLLCNLATLIVFCLSGQLFAAETIEFKDKDKSMNIGGSISIFEDASGTLTIDDVISKEFIPSTSPVPNLGITKSHFWVKIPITNKTDNDNLFLELSLAIIDYIEFYSPSENGKFSVIKTGEEFIFENRKYNDPNYLFDLHLSKEETKTYYLKIKSNEAVQIPIKIGTKTAIYSEIKIRDLLSGIYFGIMLVMILYNLFIYFSTRDKSYLYYVIYIICILLTQTSLQGYTFQYIWPNKPLLAQYSLFILPSLSSITGMFFMNVFLRTKEYSKKLNNLAIILSIPFILSISLSFAGNYKISQLIMEIGSGIVSIYILVTAILILRKGFSPAKYFLVAWVIFLIGVTIYILKDFGVLPFNNFTRYTMQIGSGIETILLSFALAARINIYRKEKEEAQDKTVEVLKENEKIIKDQNIVLEQKVEERTAELNQTLSDLKETQSQLVDAEKMSSLGQLTAGIAHEINNPINFVSSNITPLRQDIADVNTIIAKYEELEDSDNIPEKLKEIDALKKELDFDYLKTELSTIIDGIEDGAKRTTEIVSGLRNFSRLDEGELKSVNINEGIESTLILIKNKLNRIKIKKKLGNIPNIECNPGKINQIVMNLIDNAIYAIDKKDMENKNGAIEVITESGSDSIILTIKDNGIGIDEAIKDKLFDPFFTTKDVGEGTGLGLSIVRSIIDNHNGKITVNSIINKGTEMIVEIPIKRKDNGEN
ncbi:MAG: ATPase [Flavobacteriales bacterium]|nr:MAG: ATPase [Flavobacteriales bacterium]